MVEFVSFVMECGEVSICWISKEHGLERDVGKDLNEGVDISKTKRDVFRRSPPFWLPFLPLPVTTAVGFYVEAKLRNCV